MNSPAQHLNSTPSQTDLLATVQKQQALIRSMEHKLLTLYRAASPFKGTGHAAIDQALTSVDAVVALTRESVRREALYDLLGIMQIPKAVVEQLKGSSWDHAADAVDTRYHQYIELAQSLIKDSTQ